MFQFENWLLGSLTENWKLMIENYGIRNACIIGKSVLG